MQNKKKWLAVGGGALAVVAVGAAVLLNQGGLLTGNLSKVASVQDSAFFKESTANGLTAIDQPVYRFADGDNNYILYGSKEEQQALSIEDNADGTSSLVMDADVFNTANIGGNLYFRLSSSNGKEAAPSLVEMTDNVRYAAPMQSQLAAPAVEMQQAQMQQSTQMQQTEMLNQALMMQKNQAQPQAVEMQTQQSAEQARDYNANQAAPIEQAKSAQTESYQSVQAAPIEQAKSAQTESYQSVQAAPVEQAKSSQTLTAPGASTIRTPVTRDSQLLKIAPAAALYNTAHAAGEPVFQAEVDQYDYVKLSNVINYQPEKYEVQLIKNGNYVTKFPLIIKNTLCQGIKEIGFDQQEISYDPTDASASKVFSVKLNPINSNGQIIPQKNVCKNSMALLVGGDNIHVNLSSDADNTSADGSFKYSNNNPNVFFNGFLKQSDADLSFDFGVLNVGASADSLKTLKSLDNADNLYAFYLKNNDGSKIISQKLIVAMKQGSTETVNVSSDSADVLVHRSDVDADLVTVTVRNNTNDKINVNKLALQAQISADSTGSFEDAKDVSANMSANSVVSDTKLQPSSPVAASSVTAAGKLSFSVNQDILPHRLANFKLSADKVNEINYPNDTKLRYYVTDLGVTNLTTPAKTLVVSNNAKSTDKLPTVTVPMFVALSPVCTHIDKVAFTLPQVTFDANTAVTSADNHFTIYKGANEIGLANNICPADLSALGIPDKAVGFYTSLTDGHGHTELDHFFLKGLNTTKLLGDFITVTPEVVGGLKELKFTADFTKSAVNTITITPGESYGLSLSALTLKDPMASATDPTNWADPGKPFAKYQLLTVAKLAPAASEKADDTTPPTIINNYYTTTNTTTTTPATTQPSTEPCVVNGKTFYLADGPNSSYCQDLQKLGEVSATAASTSPKAQEIAQTDKSSAELQVRYTTALFIQRLINDIIINQNLDASLRVKNLSDTWYTSLVDANDIAGATSQEKTDFKNVYSTGILTGRINPLNNNEVTLAPTDRISYAELLAMFRKAVNSVIGTTSVVNEKNLPAFLDKLYVENPKDYTWVAEAVSFGVQYNIISTNEFDQNTLFQVATRADMTRFLARFSDAIEANPNLLGK